MSGRRKAPGGKRSPPRTAGGPSLLCRSVWFEGAKRGSAAMHERNVARRAAVTELGGRASATTSPQERRMKQTPQTCWQRRDRSGRLRGPSLSAFPIAAAMCGVGRVDIPGAGEDCVGSLRFIHRVRI